MLIFQRRKSIRTWTALDSRKCTKSIIQENGAEEKAERELRCEGKGSIPSTIPIGITPSRHFRLVFSTALPYGYERSPPAGKCWKKQSAKSRFGHCRF